MKHKKFRLSDDIKVVRGFAGRCYYIKSKQGKPNLYGDIILEPAEIEALYNLAFPDGEPKAEVERKCKTCGNLLFYNRCYAVTFLPKINPEGSCENWISK